MEGGSALVFTCLARVPTPQHHMNELAGQSLGGYVLEEELGRGSMGMVYRGKQIALEREVAIKVLPSSLAQDPSYVARFIREAQIIAGLNHPNIVQIYDAGQQNAILYFVMEYVQGPTIGSLLQLDGSMPHYLAAEYAAQIADALDAAYTERNVIHRDIKPENLMLDRWGKIKVMDFGLARAPGLQEITLATTLVGSIYYSSPEQIWGKPLDNRSDIYALGVVLYEMVTGQRPFSGRTLQAVTSAITNGTTRPPSELNPDLSPELAQIILTAMACKREERFVHASQMAEQLRALHLHAPSPTPGGPARNDDKPSRPDRASGTRGLLSNQPQDSYDLYPHVDTIPTGALPASTDDLADLAHAQLSLASPAHALPIDHLVQQYSPGLDEQATEPLILSLVAPSKQASEKRTRRRSRWQQKRDIFKPLP